MKRSTWRKFLIIDFCGAFAGAILYLIFFDLLTGPLGLPAWVATTQLAASFIYGVYGLLVFLSGTRRVGFFRFLILMNSVYACFCALASFVIFISGIYWGPLLLFVEALVIFVLVKFESESIRQ